MGFTQDAWDLIGFDGIYAGFQSDFLGINGIHPGFD